jgi:hypothetical protein
MSALPPRIRVFSISSADGTHVFSLGYYALWEADTCA